MGVKGNQKSETTMATTSLGAHLNSSQKSRTFPWVVGGKEERRDDDLIRSGPLRKAWDSCRKRPYRLILAPKNILKICHADGRQLQPSWL